MRAIIILISIALCGCSSHKEDYVQHYTTKYIPQNASEAIPFATGVMGLMIWNENGITIQITDVDSFPNYGERRIVLNDSIVDMQFNLYDNELLLQGKNSNYSIIGKPKSRTIAISKDDSLLWIGEPCDYSELRKESKHFWNSFWDESRMEIPDSSIAAMYYWSKYLITGGAYGEKPFHFMNGVYRTGASNWSDYFWHLNTRCVYNSFIGTEIAEAYFNLYLRNVAALKGMTKHQYGLNGIKVPEVMRYSASADEYSNNGYVGKIFTVGLELSQLMMEHYRITKSQEFLSRAYVLMREVAIFYTEYICLTNTAKPYEIFGTNARETYWNVTGSITDIAGIRSTFPLIIEASKILGKDEHLRSAWLDVLQNIKTIPQNESIYLPAWEYAGTNNVENSELDIIYPYGIFDSVKAVNTFLQRRFQSPQIWSYEPIWALRLGLRDYALQYLKAMIERNCRWKNFICNDGNGRFETNGIILTVVKLMYGK